MNGKPWTEQQLEALRDLYPHKRTADIIDVVGRAVGQIYGKASELGLHKTQEFLNSEASGRLVGGTRGIAHRFQKGKKSWNAGMKGLQIGGAETQFKRGNKPCNYLPIGSVITRTDGYSQTKIGDPNVWKLTHRLAWEQAGNELPVHPYVLRFKDGNKLNCAIDNLEISTKAAMMAANTVHTLPESLRKAIQLNGVLKRKINGK